jgi:hypothetical protein
MNMTELKEGLDNYKLRLQPGSFLRALLENNLMGVVAHADPTSALYLAEFVIFTNSYLPGFMWGAPHRVENWLAGRVDQNGDPLPKPEVKPL